MIHVLAAAVRNIKNVVVETHKIIRYLKRADNSQLFIEYKDNKNILMVKKDVK